MESGFFLMSLYMKIAICQLNPQIGNFDYNFQKINSFVEKAKNNNADIAIFPEMSVSGYPPFDLLFYNDYIQKSNDTLNKISQLAKDITIIVGSPYSNEPETNNSIFNSGVVFQNQKCVSQIHKTVFAQNDVFDDYRYFSGNNELPCVNIDDKKLAIIVGGDFWQIKNDYANPFEVYSKQKPDIFINISASLFGVGQFENKQKALNHYAEKYNAPIININMAGAQTELIFDGRSMIALPDGNNKILNAFEEDFFVYDTNNPPDITKQSQKTDIALIHDALIFGIKEYFAKLGIKKAALGLSGGLDSAVVAYLASEAIGSDNVDALLMPSKFSSQHSIDDAVGLAKNLKINYEIISIEKSFDTFSETLKPYFKDLPFNVAEENIQARIRGLLLMAWSNKFGNLVLNTSNKSEAAVGYGTLYGDMCGGLSVIGDLYKTQVYQLANFINRNKEIIPKNTITKVPSAELRPNQKDSDSLPDYNILDEVLRLYIEEMQSPADIISRGFDKDIVARVCKMVNANEYKRYQAPPVLRVSSKAFGLGRKMPLISKLNI